MISLMIVERNSQPPLKMENKLLYSCPHVNLISLLLLWQRPKGAHKTNKHTLLLI